MKGIDSYILEQLPEISELPSIKLKKQIKALATVRLMPPDSVIAAEGDICENIHLVVGGKVDVFRKIKEDTDTGRSKQVSLDLGVRPGMKVAMLAYGDLMASKYPTIDHPTKIGEENVLLGVSNTCTFVTRSFTPVITLDLKKYFRCLRDANPQTIYDMKMRCALKMNNTSTYVTSKLRG